MNRGARHLELAVDSESRDMADAAVVDATGVAESASTPRMERWLAEAAQRQVAAG